MQFRERGTCSKLWEWLPKTQSFALLVLTAERNPLQNSPFQTSLDLLYTDSKIRNAITRILILNLIPTWPVITFNAKFLPSCKKGFEFRGKQMCLINFITKCITINLYVIFVFSLKISPDLEFLAWDNYIFKCFVKDWVFQICNGLQPNCIAKSYKLFIILMLQVSSTMLVTGRLLYIVKLIWDYI